jgi:putative polyketide hydroxylase
MVEPERTPVLIVGGGLVGLSAALFLQYHGVPFILAERRDGASVLPRSRGVHTRTVEMFRQIGIEDRVHEAAASALKMGAFGGARRGATLLESEAIDISGVLGPRPGAAGNGQAAGPGEAARPQGLGPAVRPGPAAPGIARMTGADDSPSRFCFCPQVLLEPVLAGIARERGGDLRFGAEVTSVGQDDDGVTATIAGAAGGPSVTIRAGYVIAADGGSSPIRHALGITTWTLPPTHYYLNLFVRADLTALVAGRTFSQCEIANDTVRALIASKNNTDEWSFHVEYDPARDNPAGYSEEHCADLVRAAIGTPDVEVTVLARSVWDTAVRVAGDYRRGRVFLAGDSAHQHAPWGGFGANTGIADAHNLTWKLAAVLAGRAAGSLLDTYQEERRPRAVLAAEQARMRTDFLARYGARTPGSSLDGQVDSGAIMTRYRYVSAAVMPGHADGDWVGQLTGQEGTRVPHVWLDRGGQQVSTLDLCGPGFALLVSDTGTQASRWRSAAQAARAETGLSVSVHAIGPGAGLTDPSGAWPEQAGLPSGGALLVRPDAHVAARSDGGLTPDTLAASLAAFTGRGRLRAASA